MPPQLYSGVGVLLAYSFTAALLVVGTLRGGLIWFSAALAVFLAWDLGWLLTAKSVRDRSAADMMQSATRAREYMSWFLAVYGAGLALFLFDLTDPEREAFFALAARAGIPPLIFVLPFALTGLVTLFFPIQVTANGTAGGTEPSTANVTVMILNALAQKVVTFSFLYGILTLSYQLWTESS